MDSSIHAAAGSIYLQDGNQAAGQGELIVDNFSRNGDTVDDRAHLLTSEDLAATKVTLRRKGLLSLTGNKTIGSLDMASGTNLLLGGFTLTVNCAKQQAVLDGTIYLDAARTLIYDPQAGSPQVVFTGVLPTVNITASDGDAAKAGPDTGAFLISRDGTTGHLTVRYTVGGTAGGGDYAPSLTGSVIIPDGQAAVTITITPAHDTSVEGSETVILTLAGDADYNVGSDGSATVIIADCLPGDADGNGEVNDSDLSVLLTNWGAGGKAWSEGDFTGDGAVNDADLSLLLSYWD